MKDYFLVFFTVAFCLIISGLAFLATIKFFSQQQKKYYPIANEIIYKNVGYIDCYKDDGTGPWHKCGDMEVRCYIEDGGERVECPTYNYDK